MRLSSLAMQVIPAEANKTPPTPPRGEHKTFYGARIMNVKTVNASAMAVMVAGLFAAAAVSAAPVGSTNAGDQAMVKCVNSSSCKGQGACKQATNSCKGQNACKGQGFTMQKSQADCSAAQAAAKK
jgi:hypothetical protein